MIFHVKCILSLILNRAFRLNIAKSTLASLCDCKLLICIPGIRRVLKGGYQFLEHLCTYWTMPYS